MGLLSIPQSQPIALNLLAIAAADELARTRAIDDAWARYYGRAPKALLVKPGQPDDNVQVNASRVVVDTGVSYLFGKDLTITVPEDAPAAAQAYLDAIWDANRQMTLLANLAIQGGVAGHAFVRLFPDPDTGSWRLLLPDPATVTVVWSPHDFADVRRFRMQYAGTDPDSGQALVYRTIIERAGPRTVQGWTITDQVSRPDSPTWTTTGTTHWPHPFAPMLGCQNLPVPNEYWGLPDLSADVLDLARARNFLLSNLQRILRFHAHPKTWGKGFTADQLKVNPDETIILPSPQAELHNLEMASDLAAALELDRRLAEALHELARTPELATGIDETPGVASGVALQQRLGPLLAKTQTKRRLYGDLLVELCRRLLALGGYGDDLRVALHWPELLPVDPIADRQAAALDLSMGIVSRETIAAKMGYDWEEEQAKRDAEAPEPAGVPTSNVSPAGSQPEAALLAKLPITPT